MEIESTSVIQVYAMEAPIIVAGGVIFFITAIAYFFARKIFFSSSIGKKIPTAAGYPIIGNLLDMHLSVIFERMSSFTKTYGPIFHLQVLSQKFIHISEPSICREVMAKRPKMFSRGVNINVMGKKLGYQPYGLFHANDAAAWSKMKKLTVPAFSKQNLTNMSKIMFEETMTFVAKIDELSRAGTDITLPREVARFTTAFINKVAFANERVEYIHSDQFYEDVLITMQTFQDSATFPFWNWVWHFTPMYQTELKVEAANERFTTAALEVIVRQRALLATMDDEGKRNLNSLIDLMLRQGRDVTDAEILANVKTFYLVGADTTFATISWAFFLVHQHPEVVARLREEATPFFALGLGTKTDTEVCDAIVGLTYAHAVFKEVTRMCPVGPLQFLDFVDETDTLELSNGMVIERGRTVILDVKTCMMDVDYFPNPTKFDPSRWLTEDKTLLARMENAFLAFGSGPRACPGMNLANREGAVALSALFHHFDLRLACPVEEIKVEYKFAVHPNKLPMRATRRVV